MAKKTFIIIPAFNEGSVIKSVISDIKKQGYKSIIVVDDGSTDDTFLKSNSQKVYLLKHFINRGKGAAIVTGINAAMYLNADYIITMDADGQHEPKDLKKIEMSLKKGYDVVLGYRDLVKDKAPILRVFANFIANILVYILYGINVKDSQSGLRGYSKKAVLAMNISSERYEFDSYIIREMAKAKLKYKEVPIKIYYTEYSKSKIYKQNFVNSLKTIYKIIMSL